ncbi:MAG: hypothetical protein OXU96_04450 [Gammaproteobacteria bacterium]|nr:hypothetical protein [Gammaproteobacteria bacterium]
MSLTQNLKDISATVRTLAIAKDKSELLELLVSAREDALALQEENSNLKKQIESYDRFDKEMENYIRISINGYNIYQNNEDSVLYACPHCVKEHKKIHFLQGASFQCPSCKTFFPWNASHQ